MPSSSRHPQAWVSWPTAAYCRLHTQMLHSPFWCWAQAHCFHQAAAAERWVLVRCISPGICSLKWGKQLAGVRRRL